MKNIYILIALSLYCGFRMEVYCQTLPFGQVANCDDFEAASFVHTVDRASFPDNWDWRDATLSNLLYG